MNNSTEYESLVIAATPDFKEISIFDPDTAPRIEEDTCAYYKAEVCIAILNAGYKGVDLAELKLANGRFVQSIAYQHGTPEGEIYAEVCRAADEGIFVPVDRVLAAIKKLYIQEGGHHG